MNRVAAFGFVFLLSLVHAPAWALPSVISTSRTVDDATVSLRVMDQSIAGDSSSWCEISVVIESTFVPLTEGDEVYLWVYESDLVVLDDDLLWENQFQVNAGEAAAGRLERTLNCSADFEATVLGGLLEIYGKARVEKVACTGFCVYDRPSTPETDVEEVSDDGREEDDARSEAGQLAQSSLDLICADEDWFEIVMAESGQINVEVRHDPAGGRLDVDLFDVQNDPIAVGSDLPDRSMVEGRNLPAGSYFARVSPRDASNFAFYDVVVDVQVVSAVCSPGMTESRPCAQCGQEERLCGPGGTWGGWSTCEGTGECQPGDQMSNSCGFCGEDVSTCSEACTWVERSECIGEGVCKPGTLEVEPCEVGDRERRCVDDCLWEDFGPCRSSRLGAPCMGDGDCEAFFCLTQEGLFLDGYCGVAGCSSDEECGDHGSCALVFGQPYCLSRCSSDDSCRSGYTCVPTTEGGACAPRCRGDGDCFAPGEGCIESTGQCGVKDASDPGLGDTVTVLPREGMESDGCACSSLSQREDGRLFWTVFLICVFYCRSRTPYKGLDSAHR
jgi:hypothetical protein